jgi:predicted  nucleic acid-binding Zn-ribbon protein
MANVTIFCPRTGSNVQIWVPEAQPGESADAYEAVTCPSCGRLHFVNKSTRKALSDKPRSSVRR